LLIKKTFYSSVSKLVFNGVCESIYVDFSRGHNENVKLLSQYAPLSSMVQQLLLGHGLLIIKASRSHSDRHTTIGRTPLDEWSAQRRNLNVTKYNTHKRHVLGGIRTRNPSKGAATDRRLRLRGHWDLSRIGNYQEKFFHKIEFRKMLS
jgi:hypothetical protein